MALHIRLAAVLLAGLATPAVAGELLLFSQRNFQGVAFRLDQGSNSMAFSPRSVQVVDGSPWELCPRPFFGGACMRIDRPDPALGLPRSFSGVVRSARPAGSGAKEPGPDADGKGTAAPDVMGGAPAP